MPVPDPSWGEPGATTGGYSVVTSGEVRVAVATRLANLVRGLLDETQRRGYEIKASQTGGFSSRKKSHAHGLAIDINHQTADRMPMWVAALWQRYGFGWHRDRPAHFEFTGSMTDATAQTTRFLAGPDCHALSRDALPVEETAPPEEESH